MSGIEGLDDFLDQLRELERKAEELDGEHEVAFPDLFPPEFMARTTEFATIEAMLEGSRWEVETQEDFREIPDDKWDEFVAEHTRFETWQEMLSEAAGSYFGRKLELE